MKDERINRAEAAVINAQSALEREVREVFAPGTKVRCNIAGREKIYPVESCEGSMLTLKTGDKTIRRHYTTVDIDSE